MPVHIGLAEALAMGPPPPGRLSVPVFAHGSLEVRLYSPAGEDPQTPHSRDEVYVVASGTASLVDGSNIHAVATGSLVFIAAGQPHRFEDISPDFAVWVLFYGPEGGETDASGRE
jgi:mannose-6-phosphate isomerase-like protein (cupin superfamily)